MSQTGSSSIGQSSRSDRLSPAVVCAALGMLGTLSMVVLTPPFQVPDEQEHFHRAYQLSELQLRGIVRDGVAGGVLPSSLIELSESFLGTRDIHPEPRLITAQSWRLTWLALARPLDPERREFVDFTSTAFYSPLAYIPQAIAIFAGRRAGAGTLTLLYLARLVNGLVAVTLLSWAVRLMPIGREAVLVAGLLPMAVFEYASAAPDAGVIATAFLFTAISLRQQLLRCWTAGGVSIAAVSGLVFCAQKPVYAPVLFLAFPALLTRGPWKQAISALAAILIVALGGTVLWTVFSWTKAVLPYPGTSVTGQLSYITADRLAFAKTILRSFWYLSSYYYDGMVGILGWMTLYLPEKAYILAATTLLAGIFVQPRDAPRLPRYAVVWNLLILGSTVFLIMTALYLSWSKVGFFVVEGVQGRYFLPLLALVCATICSIISWRPLREGSPRLLTVVYSMVAVELLIADVAIVKAYQIF